MGVIASYAYAVDLMNVQTAWIMIVKSNVTVNLVAIFGLWGIMSDQTAKKLKWSKTKGWLVFGAGIVAMIIVFRFAGGYVTIWG